MTRHDLLIVFNHSFILVTCHLPCVPCPVYFGCECKSKVMFTHYCLRGCTYTICHARDY